MSKTVEGEHERESQQEPAWRSLASIFKISQPFFEKILFLEGYDISSNIYAIVGDYVTIVDPGNDYTAYVELFALGFKSADIKKVVITHGHSEHAAGAFELFRYEGVELEMIFHEAGPSWFKATAERFGCRVTEVAGGETLELSGFECELIHTPGHTMDSICLYHAPTRTVFTGDTVLPYAVASPDPSAGGRLEYHLFSLRTLLKMEIENVLPGHGLPVASDSKKLFEGTYAGLIKKLIGLETPWIEGATLLARKGYLEEGLFCCEKALGDEPKNLMALQLKALCLNDLGRFNEAINVLDYICAHTTDKVHALIGKGYALMGLWKYDESLKYFDEALKINPNIKDALVYKGMALYLSGRVDEAMDIEVFKTEFSEKMKEVLQKMQQEKQAATQQGT